MVVLAERELAPDLDQYRGQWVAIKDSRVVASGTTPTDVLEQVRGKGLGRVELHRVPEDGDAAYIL